MPNNSRNVRQIQQTIEHNLRNSSFGGCAFFEKLDHIYGAYSDFAELSYPQYGTNPLQNVPSVIPNSQTCALMIGSGLLPFCIFVVEHMVFPSSEMVSCSALAGINE